MVRLGRVNLDWQAKVTIIHSLIFYYLPVLFIDYSFYINNLSMWNLRVIVSLSFIYQMTSKHGKVEGKQTELHLRSASDYHFFLIFFLFPVSFYWLWSLIYQYSISLSLYHPNFIYQMTRKRRKCVRYRRTDFWHRSMPKVRSSARHSNFLENFNIFLYNRHFFAFWGGSRNHGSVVSRTVVSWGLPVYCITVLIDSIFLLL